MPFEVLGIASRALAAQQLALEVTGNNLANATTPGYQAETANLTEVMPSPDAAQPTTIIGNGVVVSSVTRASNAFLSKSVRTQTSAVGYSNALSQGLTQVQNLFQEPQTGGLAEIMNQFYQSWLTLSQNPQSQAARQSVLQDGRTLAQTFNSMSQSLNNEAQSVNLTLTNQVGQINNLAQQIGQLNQQIATVSTSGQQPNDLFDQRGQLLNQLSKITNISYAPAPASAIDVYIGSHALVLGRSVYQMKTGTVVIPAGSGGNPTTAVQPVWSDTGSPVQAQSGSLAGNMALLYQSPTPGSGSTTIAPGYLTRYGQSLDLLATYIMQTVNSAQINGYDLSGANTTTSSTGTIVPLPSFFTGTNAGNISVNSALTPDLIAAATTANAPGDGSNAQNIFNLSNTNATIGSATSTTPSGYYTSLVGQVGLDGQNAQSQVKNGQSTLTALQNNLQASVGVDVNQQSVNMIQEQQSYMAAAKLVATQQTLIQSLLAAVS